MPLILIMALLMVNMLLNPSSKEKCGLHLQCIGRFIWRLSRQFLGFLVAWVGDSLRPGSVTHLVPRSFDLLASGARVGDPWAWVGDPLENSMAWVGDPPESFSRMVFMTLLLHCLLSGYRIGLFNHLVFMYMYYHNWIKGVRHVKLIHH